MIRLALPGLWTLALPLLLACGGPQQAGEPFALPSADSQQHIEGLDHLEAGELAAALPLLRAAHQAAPGDADRRLDLVTTLVLLGKGEEASALLAPLVHPVVDSRRAGLLRVEALLAAGFTRRAVTRAKELVDAEADWADAWYAWGRAALQQRRFGDARQAFEGALRLTPDDVDALMGLHAATLGGGEAPELGVRIAEIEGGAHGADRRLVHNRGVDAELRGDLEAAEALYLQALEPGPADPWTHYNLGRLLHASRGLEAARPHYRAFADGAEPRFEALRAEVRQILGDGAPKRERKARTKEKRR